MMYFCTIIWIYALLLWNVVSSDDALKNHRLEKRQDDSFLFFGGWRPVRSGASYYHGSTSGRYHDILSALPTSFDSTSRYYTHALPSMYHKDIYSYYPRPAIKSAPKKNTPVYMERLRPQKPKQQQNYGGGGSGGYAPQIIDLPQIDLKQIQNLHEILQRAKDIPFPNLNIPYETGKPVELLELSVHPLPQGGHSYGGKSFKGYGRNKNSQNRGKKSNYGRIPQSRIPFQPPHHYEFMSLPKNRPIIPQIIPKEISVGSIASILPAVEDALKNIQVVEVPVPSGYGGTNTHPNQYRVTSNLPQQIQYATSPKNAQVAYSHVAQYAHQTKQPSKSRGASKSKPKTVVSEPIIEAELIKLSEEDLKDLLSNLHVLDKAPDDLLKYLQIGDLDKIKDAIQLVIQGENHGEVSSGNYQPSGSQSQSDGYSKEDQYSGASGYSPKGSATYKLNSGGYQIEEQVGNQVEHNAAGYEIESSKSSGGYYGQSGYQNDGRSAVYEQQGGYDDSAYQHQSSSYQSTSQEYSKEEAPGNQGGQKYIQVLSPPDQNGYRREPVLAVEIQHGQTIEDAIKSLDRETLKKLGAHGENGLEIEVVEVPIDEYAQESKRSETVVPSKNSTLVFKKKVLDKKS